MKSKILFVTLMAVILFSACKKDKKETTGNLSGIVTDAETETTLSDVLIITYNASDNSQTGNSIRTGSDGKYEIELTSGDYYLKLYKQSYNEIPPKGISAIPYTVSLGQTTTTNFKMYPSTITNGGWLTGNVSAGGSGIANALVIANNGTSGFSSVSDSNGDFYIYNVPAGSYNVKAFLAGYNSEIKVVSTTASTESSGVDISLTEDASGSLSGHITFLATGNIEIDVTLINPFTKEIIPGLSAMTTGGNYSLNNIPDGTYIAQATYENDTKVMDPDWIIKNGEPVVTINGGVETKDYSVTGAVKLTSPTNASDSAEPVELTTITPEFTWTPYSSSSDYVIEVSDANGNVIWGGFSNNWQVKNIVINKSQTSIVFNSDGNAIKELEPGYVYRWRIYASKDDSQETVGWKLISASEDKMGLFKIVE